MNTVINPFATVKYVERAAGGGGYPRQVVVDLGRPGMRYGIEMRDLIHFTAYRLDTGE